MALGQERRTVTCGTTPVEYTLTRKQVRNINLRISPDCSVAVSANIWQAVSDIDAFVQSKGTYILDAQRKFRELAQRRPKPHLYATGEQFPVMGHTLTLNVVKGSPCGVTSDGTTLTLTVTDVQDAGKKKRLIERYMTGMCAELFSEISRDTYPLFAQYHIPEPSIRIRSMKSRWGTCLTGKAVITLNSQLIEVPRECTEYVILHEYCHFIHPNHSKRFYALVARFMPDWKDRKRLLENAH